MESKINDSSAVGNAYSKLLSFTSQAVAAIRRDVRFAKEKLFPIYIKTGLNIFFVSNQSL